MRYIYWCRATRELLTGKMTESLNRSRAGHVSAITRNQSSLKPILDKNPSEISRSDLTRLKVSLKRCEEQQAKTQQLDADIIASLEAADAGQDATDQELVRLKTTVSILKRLSLFYKNSLMKLQLLLKPQQSQTSTLNKKNNCQQAIQVIHHQDQQR